MSRPLLLTLLLCSSLFACGGGDSPTSPTTTAVSVVFPAGGTIFIGDAVQLEARATLSDGTTRTATNATWGSDNPAVATVSQTGLVTAVAAGEATIFADVNPRGTLRIRVYPSFGGTWTGTEVLDGCEATGAFAGICGDVGFEVGEVFFHQSTYTQTDASVDAVLDTGEETSASMTGTITIDGELQLSSAPVLPAEPPVDAQIRNWRSRADVPSRMTGTYEGFFTAPGVPGSVTVSIRLQNVVRSGAAATQLSRTGDTALAHAISRMVNHLEASR